jgi:hypothetical protein
MTELEKAYAWFNLKKIDCRVNEDQLYVYVQGIDNVYQVLVSTSEIIYRAEEYDYELEKIANG